MARRVLNILVFNCGSSSLNYKLFTASGPESLTVTVYGKAHRVGVHGTEPAFIEHHYHGAAQKQVVPLPDHRTAAALVLRYLQDVAAPVDAIGHRFVHGGPHFQRSALLTPETLTRLEACLPLAPIHNPNSMSVIHECRAALPAVPEYVTFDTAFHAPLRPAAYTYPLPAVLRERYGLRKYGFHGLSYQFVTREAARFLGVPLADLRLVACHLGTGGSSVAAVAGGCSVDTTMGYSPLAGLMMSTRTGDLDPLLPLYLMRERGLTPAQLEQLFNKQSGLLGISGLSSDLRDLLRRRDETGDERAALAIALYIQRLKQAIGAYAVLLGGLDALLFTDDIGVQNWQVRAGACDGLAWCGVVLDEAANRTAPTDRIAVLNASTAPVRILSVPTDEERVIGMEGAALLAAQENQHDPL